MLIVYLLIYLTIYLPVYLSARSKYRPTEQERVDQWRKVNTWPPRWQNETKEMKLFYEKREREIMAIPGVDERWENWLQFTAHRMVPKFTERGFEAPDNVMNKLYEAVNSKLERFDDIRTEGNIDVIYHDDDMEPKFVPVGMLTSEVLELLRPYHEAWAGGIELVGTSAYGVRFYRNGSSLVMHYDKIETHVISSIVHIAHQYDDDNEPWPIQIEDHNGVLHSVNLEPGQMLFYESAKCLHGRLKSLKGKYYGSIFVHYKPKDESIWKFSHDDVIANVPPHWRDGVVEDKGSRYAGAAITIDSRVSERAPPRIFVG
eukprot:gene18806-24575_t